PRRRGPVRPGKGVSLCRGTVDPGFALAGARRRGRAPDDRNALPDWRGCDHRAFAAAAAGHAVPDGGRERSVSRPSIGMGAVHGRRRRGAFVNFRALLTAGLVAFCNPAAAHHVDPFELVDRALSAHQEKESYADVRAVLSAGLRAAPHDGRLDPGFGLVYAIYADTARFEGNAAFSLQLADEGLALVNAAAEPNTEIRNALIVSRAYALAELGRYDEAADEATIASLWLEQRFGAQARADLEAEIKGWLAARNTDILPSVAQVAVDLLQKAETALIAGDTGSAIALASRAMLPDNSGLSRGAERLVKAWCRSITGAAYGVEGRHREAVATLREAVDLLSSEPWDGRSIVTLYPDLVVDLTD